MLYLLCAALVVAADQLFKLWIVRAIEPGEVMRLIPGVMQLTHMHNYAAAFSLFEGLKIPIIIITFIVCIVIAAALIMKKPRSRLERAALALVLGGAVGNLIDRLMNGYVVDMFQTTFIDFPVFNIADCAITVGGIMFCLCIIFSSRDERIKPLPAAPGENEAVFEELSRFEAAREEGENDDPSNMRGN